MINPDDPDTSPLSGITLSPEEAEALLKAERAAREAEIAKVEAARRERAEWLEKLNAAQAEHALLEVEKKRLEKQARRVRMLRDQR